MSIGQIFLDWVQKMIKYYEQHGVEIKNARVEGNWKYETSLSVRRFCRTGHILCGTIGYKGKSEVQWSVMGLKVGYN